MDEQSSTELLKALITEAEQKYQVALETITELRKDNHRKCAKICNQKRSIDTTKAKNTEYVEREKERKKEIAEYKKAYKEMQKEIRNLKLANKKQLEEIAEYNQAFQRMKKELATEKDKVKDYEVILNPKSSTTLTEDGYTERESAYRRIARKYAHKCDDCPLKIEKRKKENVWME